MGIKRGKKGGKLRERKNKILAKKDKNRVDPFFIMVYFCTSVDGCHKLLDQYARW